MKLMIVDDDRQIRSGLAESIDWQGQGIDVVLTAADGNEALMIFEQEKPEIVLTDIRMPGLDGLELGKEIKKRSPETTVIILSGYSDFEYARQAMRFDIKDYLLKPVQIDDLISVVKTARDLSRQKARLQKEQDQHAKAYRDNMLSDLLYSSSKDTQHMLQQLTELWQIEPKALIRVAVVEIDQAWKISSLSERAEILARIESVIREISGEALIATCHHDEKLIAVTQVPSDCRSDFAFDRSEKRIPALIKQINLPTTFTIAFSRPGAAHMIRDLFKQAEMAVQAKLYAGHAQILVADHEMNFDHTFQIDPKILRELQQAVWDLDPISANDLIAAIFSRLRVVRNCSKKIIEKIALDLKDSLIEGVKTLGFDFEGLFGRNIQSFEQRTGLETLYEYESWITGLYEIVLTGLSELKGARTSVAIRKAAEYIHQNFSNDITLEEVAEKVQKSANYFSHLFKKVIGISFCEYLNRVRVQEAKKLLRTTNLLAYEIAEKVGFQDYKYFNQVFRKLEGCSPSQYRKG